MSSVVYRLPGADGVDLHVNLTKLKTVIHDTNANRLTLHLEDKQFVQVELPIEQIVKFLNRWEIVASYQ